MTHRIAFTPDGCLRTGAWERRLPMVSCTSPTDQINLSPWRTIAPREIETSPTDTPRSRVAVFGVPTM